VVEEYPQLEESKYFGTIFVVLLNFVGFLLHYHDEMYRAF